MKIYEAAPHLPYPKAVEKDGTLYISGQLGINPETEKLFDSVEDQLKQALKNIFDISQEAGMDKTNIVRCVILLDSLADYPKVNTIYTEMFAGHKPSRVCYEVAKLPLEAKVEVSAIAAK